MKISSIRKPLLLPALTTTTITNNNQGVIFIEIETINLARATANLGRSPVKCANLVSKWLTVSYVQRHIWVSSSVARADQWPQSDKKRGDLWNGGICCCFCWPLVLWCGQTDACWQELMNWVVLFQRPTFFSRGIGGGGGGAGRPWEINPI